jgi:hypothetical protein
MISWDDVSDYYREEYERTNKETKEMLELWIYEARNEGKRIWRGGKPGQPGKQGKPGKPGKREGRKAVNWESGNPGIRESGNPRKRENGKTGKREREGREVTHIEKHELFLLVVDMPLEVL